MQFESQAGNDQPNWRTRYLHRMPRLCATGVLIFLATLQGCSKSEPDELIADKSKFAVADDPAPSTSASPDARVGGESPATAQPGVSNTPIPSNSPPPTNSDIGANAGPGPSPAVDPRSAATTNLPSIGAPGIANDARSFATFAAHTSEDPPALLQYFSRADDAIRDLTIAAQNRQVEKEQFMEAAKRICTLKYNAAVALHANAKSTPDQQKAGRLCQLESLSNLAGLKDVESAKKLQALAMELEKGPDLDLAHQSKLVMIGFKINALEEGVEKDPSSLLKAIDELFTRPEDRGYPELMAVQNCAQRLVSMGFKDAAALLVKKLSDTYRDSPDPELNMMAWTMEVTSSTSFQTFTQALQKMLAMQTNDGKELLAASRELCDKFPSINTLVQLANHLVNIEYSGNIETSRQLAALIREKLPAFSASPLAEQIDKHIQTQQERLNSIGQPLQLENLVTVTGQPFNWAQYRGKVVLVDFWASWCVPCLNEIPNIQKAHQELAAQGFEVVGINLDDKDLPEVDNFIRGKNFPWATLRSDNPNALGFETPVAKKLNISAIPFMVLVDKEGKIAALHVRGEKIIPTVQAMLGVTTAQ